MRKPATIFTTIELRTAAEDIQYKSPSAKPLNLHSPDGYESHHLGSGGLKALTVNHTIEPIYTSTFDAGKGAKNLFCHDLQDAIDNACRGLEHKACQNGTFWASLFWARGALTVTTWQTSR